MSPYSSESLDSWMVDRAPLKALTGTGASERPGSLSFTCFTQMCLGSLLCFYLGVLRPQVALFPGDCPLPREKLQGAF